MISLDSLNTFITFCESSNIFEAAKILGMSQPSVSVHLKRVEDYYGVELFSLSGKKKVLNSHGKLLYESISNDLKKLRFSAQSVKKSLQSKKELTLTIACRREIFPMILEKYQFEGSLKLVSATSKEAIELLEENKVDIAISHKLPDSLDIVAKEMFTIGSHFLLPKKIKNKKITLDLLNESNFLAYDKDLPQIRDWLKAQGHKQTDLKVKLYLDDWNLITEMVKKGEGVTLCPSSFGKGSGDLRRVAVKDGVVPSKRFYFLQKKDTMKIFSLREVIKR